MGRCDENQAAQLGGEGMLPVGEGHDAGTLFLPFSARFQFLSLPVLLAASERLLALAYKLSQSSGSRCDPSSTII